jgi:hypothetical protein
VCSVSCVVGKGGGERNSEYVSVRESVYVDGHSCWVWVFVVVVVVVLELHTCVAFMGGRGQGGRGQA